MRPQRGAVKLTLREQAGAAEVTSPFESRGTRDRVPVALGDGEQIFHVSKAHTASVVEPDRVADDVGRKSISVVARQLAVHWPNSVSHQLNLTIPFGGAGRRLRDHGSDQPLRFALDAVQMVLVTEALGIELVDVLGP